MLDVLKLKITTKFMRGFVAKIVSKKIYEKFGCKVDIQFRDISVDTVDGNVLIHVDADGKINKTECERFLESIDWAIFGSFFFIRENYKHYNEKDDGSNGAW